MSRSPNLELPQRPPRPRSSAAVGLTLALVLVLLVLHIVVLLRLPTQGPVAWTQGGPLVTPEDHKELAIRLEDKNLPVAAAESWEAYVREAPLDADQAAKIMLRVGKLKQLAGDYDEAIRQYYLAEQLLGARGTPDEELQRLITMGVRECFRKLGQYGDLAREMAERATPTSDDGTLAGQQVVADIDGQKMTISEFDRIVQDQIEQTINSQRGLTPEEADAFRQRLYEQLSDPQEKARQLQRIVISRVLAKEARRQGVDESPAFRERIVAMADTMLADVLMAQEIDKRATVTQQDIERYFEANKDRYADPATTTIAHILCDTREEADQIIARANAGESFEELARSASQDAQTRSSGGRLPRPIRRDGDSVPGVGRDAALHARLWEAAPGSVLAEPYKSEAGWEVIRVVDRTERVDRSLDEVRDRVAFDTRVARRQEVSEQFVKELLEAGRVRMYPEAFALSPARPAADKK